MLQYLVLVCPQEVSKVFYVNKNTQYTYTEQLEESLHQLIQLVVDPALFNFLSESERKRFSEVLSNLPAKP